MKYIIKISCVFVFILSFVLITACGGDSGTKNEPTTDSQDDTGDSTAIDSTAPGEATLIVTAAGGGSITLSWTEPSDEDFDHVLITWNPSGTDGTTVDAGTTTYDITGLTNGTEYTITVKTVDTSDNSSIGESVKITPPSASVPVHYIYTAAELDAINDNTGNLDDYYILMSDLNLSSYSNWTPVGDDKIGDQSDCFKGTFDGNGHTISNLTISSDTYYMGLFGAAYSALIENLELESVSISGTDDESEGYGGLAGYIDECTISYCNVSGSVSGSDNIGGLIGDGDNSIITSCYTSVNITMSTGDEAEATGGLIGKASDTTITGCHSSGTVTNNDYYRAGGLIGDGNRVTISDSYSTSTVDAYNMAGGLAGYISGSTIENCYATGNVTGSDDNIGGFIGYMAGSASTVTDSYATGSVSGVSDVGGFAGDNSTGNISGCYATGNITMSADSSSLENIGGLVGYNRYDGSIENSYATGNIAITGSSTYNATYIGALIGNNIGDADSEAISQCYAAGDITVTITGTGNATMIGGLIGRNQDRTISNCFTTGNVTAMQTDDEYAGGLIGTNIYGSVAFFVEYCYQSGIVQCSNSEGGLFGNNSATGITLTGCFYNDDDNDDTLGTGITLTQMQAQSTFTDSGWDFYGEDTNGTDDIWSISASINSGYPYLNDLEP